MVEARLSGGEEPAATLPPWMPSGSGSRSGRSGSGAGLRQADLGQSARVPREVISEVERGIGERVSLARHRPRRCGPGCPGGPSHSLAGRAPRSPAGRGPRGDGRRRRRPTRTSRMGDAARGLVLDLGRARLDRRSRLASGNEGPARRRGEVSRAGPPGDPSPARSENTAGGRDRGPFDWRPEIVAALLVVAESPTSRGRVQRSAVVLDAALPDRGPRVRAWLRAPSGPLRGLLFLSNAAQTHTRRATWRRERVHRPERSRMRACAAVDKARTVSETPHQTARRRRCAHEAIDNFRRGWLGSEDGPERRLEGV